MEFSRLGYWSRCHVLLQGIFLEGLNPRLLCLLHWQMGSLTLAPPGKSLHSRLRGDFIFSCFSYFVTMDMYQFKNKRMFMLSNFTQVVSTTFTILKKKCLRTSVCLEEGLTTHSSILAWRISRTEEPGGLLSMGLQRVGQDWTTNTFTCLCLWVELCLADIVMQQLL